MAEQDHSVPQTVILHGNVSKQSDINWLIGKVAMEIAEANLLRSLLPGLFSLLFVKYVQYSPIRR